MTLIDEQIAKLAAIDVAQTKRSEFDEFWTATVERARTAPLNVRGGRIEYPLPNFNVRDLTIEGLDGTPVRVWMILPPEAKNAPVPCVVHYHGAGGSRDEPSSHTMWPSAGCGFVAMDFRMQGGLTGSKTGFVGHSNPRAFNMGVLERDASYFYHVWTDALRCIELALLTPGIDPARIAVHGGSQGGATSLAMAALHPAVALCMADVPSNCWLEKRLFDRAGGMAQAAEFVRDHPDTLDDVCATLSYYDNINLADRIRCPVMVSCGLKDPVCPPENVYAAYNKITAPKEIHSYPFGEHGGGGSNHAVKKLRFVRERFFGG